MTTQEKHARILEICPKELCLYDNDEKELYIRKLLRDKQITEETYNILLRIMLKSWKTNGAFYQESHGILYINLLYNILFKSDK